MTDLNSLRARLRLELHDQGSSFEAAIIGGGTIDRFELPYDVISEADFNVVQGGVTLVEGTDFDMDYRNGVLTLDQPVASGERLDVSGTHYETYLDSELDTFIETAFLQHTHGKTTSAGDIWGYADLPGVEEYLIVLLAMIQVLWAMATDASRNIDIMVPDGVSIPEGQRFQQIMSMIQAWQMRYDDLAMKLNVGLSRIEMFSLRRVSRSTNRLVPIYRAQEYDEITPPVRVRPGIDPGL